VSRHAPLIGVTGRRLPATAMGDVPLGLVDTFFDVVMVEYAEKLSLVGGTPVAIPRAADLDRLVARLDALVLSGGEDVDPGRYGREANGGLPVDCGRDEFELGLLEVALAAEIPVLGICRGAMLLNVACGGTLVDHLVPVDGFSHAETEKPRHSRRHRVVIEPESLLASILGTEVQVNSYHHQAVEHAGKGVAIVGWSEDGVVEAVELADRRVVGVHWHPEMFLEPDPLFVWLVLEAGRRGRSAA
jgi:putative glutamine amidotransferase